MRNGKVTGPIRGGIALVLLLSSSLIAAADDATDTAARLRQLEDREQIRQLLVDYGRTLDSRDFAAFAGLFAERGGQWIGGFGTVTGRAEIQTVMQEKIGAGTGSPNFHVFTNESITLNGDQATALTKWLFVVQDSEKRPSLVYLGHYDDTMVRENGRWLFQRRVVHGDIPAQDPLATKGSTP
jgi:hypothetical protein